MNTFSSNIQKEARKIGLTSGERESMRLRLEGVMQADHLAGGGPSPSPYFSFVTPRFAVPVLVLIIVVGGGGISYAAEGTLPGDLLYPVKITVNESVRGALAFSAASKAEWHATAAERRMVEVETLADRGALTPEVRSELEANFEDHAQEIEGIVDEAEVKDPVRAADIRTRFTSSLAAHANVIARLGDGSEDSETRRESKNFAERVNERERKFARADRPVAVKTGRDTSGEVAVRTFAKTDAAIPAPTLAIGRDADAAVAIQLEENASTTLREAEVEFDIVRLRLNEKGISQVRDQISRVRAQIQHARDKRTGGDVSRAREDGERALGDATALRTFLKAQHRSEQNILPATLSDETEEDSRGEEWKEEKPEDLPAIQLPL